VVGVGAAVGAATTAVEAGSAGAGDGETTFSGAGLEEMSLYLKLPCSSSTRVSFQGHSETRVVLNDSVKVILFFFIVSVKKNKKK
jgi:L-aminopeptidase/D-esterase-like protein